MVNNIAQLIGLLSSGGLLLWLIKTTVVKTGEIAGYIEVIKSETAHIRTDHDKIIILIEKVETLQKDLNKLFSKVREIERG